MALTFDPTASLPANHIVDEVQIGVTDAGVYPVETPFYSLDFQMWATRLSDSIEVELVESVDFILSSIFYSVAANTNRDIHSFIIILKPLLWTEYRITYRGVGGIIDGVLDNEIVAAVGFDRADPVEWIKFEGQDISLRSNSINDSHNHAGIIEQTQILTKAITDNLQRSYFKRDEEVAKIAVALANNAEVNSAAADINNLLALELVDPPTITSPIEGGIDYVHIDKINISSIVGNDRYDGPHDATDWEIATDSGFTNIVDSSYNDSVNLIDWAPISINASTVYYVRAKLISDSHTSDWSTVISFTTNSSLEYIETPVIISPVDNELRVSPLFVMTVNAFNVINDTDTHTSTDWEISLTSDFSNIIYQKLASGDLLSHTVDTELALDTIHYIRVKFNGLAYTSEWSLVSTITTATILEAIKLIGGTGDEVFNSVILDSVTNNYIAVGSSDSAGAGLTDAYIAIFDSSLNLVDDLLIGDTGSEVFNSVIRDPISGFYVCVGSSDSAGAGLLDAYIAIFNSSLVLQADKLIGGAAGDEIFNSIIYDAVTGFYVCVGTSSTFRNPLIDGYLAIFDNALALQNDRLIYSTGDLVLDDITIDLNSGNYICIGYSSTQGAGGDDAYIGIFNTALVLQSHKLIGDIGNSKFFGITFDSVTNNYVCVGEADLTGQGTESYIAVFDNTLALVSNRMLGGLTNDLINKIIIDSNNNYVCVGSSDSAGAGLLDMFIIIFNSSLVLQDDKLIGGTGDEVFNDALLSGDDYLCVGYSDSAGAGSDDALIMTFLKDLSLSDGAIPSITALTISSPTLNESTPILTETSPTFTEANPSFTETSPALTETPPTFTETFSTY